MSGNPILSLIRGIPWEYGDIIVDYEVGATTGALYLSLRYHLLHPEYVQTRIAKLGTAYNLRLMLVHCDTADHQNPIKELTKLAIGHNFTMMIGWSNQELARYLTLYKSFERRPPDLIRERVEKDYMSQLNSVLTTVRGVNRTDVITLASNFGSLKRMAVATPEELSLCPGLGEKKVKRLKEAFSQPFVVRQEKGKAQETSGNGPV